MNLNLRMEIQWNYIVLCLISHSSFLSSLFYWPFFKVELIEECLVYSREILGLIIDAFGDLREQLDSVKETLEVKNGYFEY